MCADVLKERIGYSLKVEERAVKASSKQSASAT
jgi:hypothetical protein